MTSHPPETPSTPPLLDRLAAHTLGAVVLYEPRAAVQLRVADRREVLAHRGGR